MPELILLRGLPGTGKSTSAKTQFPTYIHCEADEYFVGSDGVYRYDIKEASVAHAFCLYKAFLNLAAGNNVVVTNTFSKVSEILPYVRFAQRKDISYTIFECTAEYGDVHNVPSEVIADMRARWEPIPSELLPNCF